MHSTSVSLLRRLTTHEREAAWQRFVELYAPLIYHWTIRAGLSASEAADCTQDVLTALVVKLPSFEYDPNRSFRGWLRTVTVNKCRDTLRRKAVTVNRTVPLELADVAAPDMTELFSETEYRQMLAHRALEIMQLEFEPATWQACLEHVVSGDSAPEIAQRLGTTENAIYLAKSRVLRRLRTELAGLFD